MQNQRSPRSRTSGGGAGGGGIVTGDTATAGIEGWEQFIVRIGAHVSAAAPLVRCIARACDIGAETIQIFASPPHSWRPSAHSVESIVEMREAAASRGIGPIFVHGIYLINLATSDNVLLDRSITSLTEALHFCAHAGALGTIVHIGSHKGAGLAAILPQITAAIRRILDATPSETWLILENSAGQGGSIGSRFEELGAIIRAVTSGRVRVCLDTCHAFAAGYDLRTSSGCAAALQAFAEAVGVERLVAVHANDSKGGLGSGLDRHENIGAGQIGREGFRAIAAHPAFRDLPFILEVPGFEGKGPDRRNIEILRDIAAEAGAIGS
jgi:deoxyribonuclease-4